MTSERTDALNSRTTDPIALGAAVLYGLGVLAVPVMLATFVIRQEWVFAVATGVLQIVFVALFVGWSQAARCRISLDAHEIRRAGLLGWGVNFADITGYDFTETRGRTYLVLSPKHPPKRNNMSAALLGSAVPYGSFTGPLQPDQVQAFRAALQGRAPAA